MTAAVMTVTPRRGWLSMDHALTDSRDGSSAGTFEKIGVYPAERLMGGVVGFTLPMHMVRRVLDLGDRSTMIDNPEAFADEMRGTAELLRTNFAAVDGELPEGWREHGAETLKGGLYVMLVGWSAAEGRVLGYAFDLAQDFAPERVDHGHLFTPTPSPKAPEYRRLLSLYDKAEHGSKVASFHDAMMRAQYWSLEAGHYPVGYGLSRTYTTAMVEAGGVEVNDQRSH